MKSSCALIGNCSLSLRCRYWRLRLRECSWADMHNSRIDGAQAQTMASCISAMHQMRRLPPVQEVSARSPSCTNQYVRAIPAPTTLHKVSSISFTAWKARSTYLIPRQKKKYVVHFCFHGMWSSVCPMIMSGNAIAYRSEITETIPMK